jgi:hypothetical protein
VLWHPNFIIPTFISVIPAQAGIQSVVRARRVVTIRYSPWIPACAGMTAACVVSRKQRGNSF